MMTKNKIRQNWNLIKNYGIFFIAVIAAAVLFKESFFNVLTLVRPYHSWTNLFIAGILLIVFLVRKYPVICINPATIYFLFGTKKLKFVILIKSVISACFFLLLSILIALCFCPKFEWLYLLHLMSTFCLWAQLIWRKYNNDSAIWALTLWCIFSNALFAASMHISGTVINMISIVFLIMRPVQINWDRYITNMKFVYQTQSMATRKDYAAMMATANANASKSSYLISFSAKTLKRPLLAKSIIIDAFRVPVWNWIYRLFIFAVPFVLSSAEFLTEINVYIFAVSWSMLISSIIRDSTQSALDMRIKSERGLFIPYSKTQIALTYAVFPNTLLLLIFSVLVCFSSIYFFRGCGVFLLCCAVSFVWHKLILEYPNKRKTVDFFLNTTLTVFSLLLSI